MPPVHDAPLIGAKLQNQISPLISPTLLSDTDYQIFRLARRPNHVTVCTQQNNNQLLNKNYNIENKFNSKSNLMSETDNAQYFIPANDDQIFHNTFSPWRTSPLIIDNAIEASKFGQGRSKFPNHPSIKYSLENVDDFGYSSAQVECLISDGYYCFQITHHPSQSNDACCRFGFGHSLLNLQTPVGHGCASFAMRSTDNSFFSNSTRFKLNNSVMDDQINNSDVLTALIYIPQKYAKKILDLHESLKTKEIIQHKTNFYFSYLYDLNKVIKDLKKREKMIGSYIEFFRNSTSLGKPFVDLPLAIYYPTVSLYSNCKVTYNLGPCVNYEAKSIEESTRDLIILNATLDLLYSTSLL